MNTSKLIKEKLCSHPTVWSAWDEEIVDLPFPDQWTVTDYCLQARPALDHNRITEIVAAGFNQRQAELKQARTACVLVDDLTRPTCWTRVLDVVHRQLNASGIPDHAITLLVSLAGHAPMSEVDLQKKIGEAVFHRVKVVQHSQEAPFAWLEYQGHQTGLNQLYVQADFRIALGTIIPHPFAGFSGGGKAVMPGIADLASIKRNHFLVGFGRGRTADPVNSIRQQMDAIAELSNLHLSINAVCNGNREIIALYAGSLPVSFTQGVDFARQYYASQVRKDHSVLVLNAYPKDQEVVQLGNALNVVRTLPDNAASGLRAIVLVARLKTGIGSHAVFGPGGLLYRQPAPLPILKGRELLFFTPYCDSSAVHTMFASDYAVCNTWQAVLDRLAEIEPGGHNVGLFHQASMQIGRDSG